MKLNKNIFIILIVVLVVVIYGFFAWNKAALIKRASLPNSTESKLVSFEIKPGESLSIISDNLEKEGLVKGSDVFNSYARKMGMDKKIKAGVYNLDIKMSVKQIINILVSGQQSEVWITIPEGWRIGQIGDYLEEQGLTTSKEFQDRAKVKNFSSTPFLSGLSGNTTLEGYLFPDTYRVFSDTTVDEIIQVMLNGFQSKVTSDIMNKANQKGLTLNQAITLASIIEKEVQGEQDMKLVSGVFWNRLDVGQALNSCATLAFILGVDKSQYTTADTQIESPYNTYQNSGLPPGPISNPGLKAIEATVYPTESDYFYFLSRPDNGETIFSRTYEEHLGNQAKYLN